VGYRLDRERSVAEIAQMAGMAVRTMRRRLLALHRAHGRVLVNVGSGQKKIYRTTLGALKHVAPHLFLDTQASREDVLQLRETAKEQKAKIDAVAARVRSLSRQGRIDRPTSRSIGQVGPTWAKSSPHTK
jgi:hypothetical protein